MCMLPRGSFCFVLNQLGSTNLLGLEFHFLNTQPLWEGSHFAVQRKIVCKCSIGICPLKPGFHVIGTIAVFAAIVKKKKKKKVQRTQRSYGNHSPAIAARIAATTIVEIEKALFQRLLSLRSLNLFFSAMAVIVAIIWKPGFTVTNRWKDLQQASRETGRFTRRIGPRRSFTLGYMGLEPTTTLHAEAYLAFFVEFFAANAWLRRAIQPIISRFIENTNKTEKTNLSLLLSLPLDIVLVTIIENTVQLRGIQWTLFSHLQAFL